MPKLTDTRKERAAELLRMLQEGPTIVHAPFGEQITDQMAEADCKIWLESWIIPEVLSLVPELKGLKPKDPSPYTVIDKLNPAKVLGSAGGRSKSPAKRKASQENGKRGGRPRIPLALNVIFSHKDGSEVVSFDCPNCGTHNQRPIDVQESKLLDCWQCRNMLRVIREQPYPLNLARSIWLNSGREAVDFNCPRCNHRNHKLWIGANSYNCNACYSWVKIDELPQGEPA